MNVELIREYRFEAAHRLPNVPPGHKCARLHGHSFRIELTVRGPVDPEMGWLFDFDALDDVMRPSLDLLDHHYLNEVPGLDNPTSENLARWLWQRLAAGLSGLVAVMVAETCDARCIYRGD
jgi:6-pyruvoyltetrahydropterin/6-carboxytetrahydropterin synthase